MYSEEGVDFASITYQDNLGCLRLIDQRGVGVFAMLDEEGVLPRGSEAKFVNRLHAVFDETPATKSAYYARNRRKPNDFAVRHFAGEVTYTVDGFLEKNKDSLAPALLHLVKISTLTILNVLAAPVPDPDTAAVAAGGGKKSGKSSDKLTLAAKFKLDLDGLMVALLSTQPQFIRCVKVCQC